MKRLRTWRIPTIGQSGKKQNCGDNKKLSDYQGWEEMIRQNTEDFQGSENTPYDVVMMDT